MYTDLDCVFIVSSWLALDVAGVNRRRADVLADLADCGALRGAGDERYMPNLRAADQLGLTSPARTISDLAARPLIRPCALRRPPHASRNTAPSPFRPAPVAQAR